MKIHLIRHGKTIANELRLYCGHSDLPLSNEGRAELVILRKTGIYPSCADSYFTSGLLRTEETLNLLYGDVERKSLPNFREFDFGRFEMHCHEELENDPDYQRWITDRTNLVRTPGGENKKDFLERVIEEYKNLEQGYESKLVICHGGVIASIMEFLFPHGKNFYDWQPKPGRGYTITYTSGKPLYTAMHEALPREL